MSGFLTTIDRFAGGPVVFVIPPFFQVFVRVPDLLKLTCSLLAGCNRGSGEGREVAEFLC